MKLKLLLSAALFFAATTTTHSMSCANCIDDFGGGNSYFAENAGRAGAGIDRSREIMEKQREKIMEQKLKKLEECIESGKKDCKL